MIWSDMRERLVVPVIGVAFCSLIACSSQPRIVSDPPAHPRLPSETVPWEEQYGRAMMKPGVIPDAPTDLHHEQKFTGDIEEHDDRGTWGVVADVLAFPFRGLGWLLSSMF